MKIGKLDVLGMVLFLIPAVVLFATFFIYPVGFVSVTSLMKWDGMSSARFLGLNNYAFLFKDEVFRASVVHNIIWALAGGLVQVPMAVMVALLLSNKPRGWKIFRTIYFFPNIISGIALAMMWSAVYNNEYGALNAFLKIIGLEQLQRNWLGDLYTSFPAIVIFWLFYVGYYMVIILAEISSIPVSYYEAANIDGASRMQSDMYITLPLIKGSVSTCMTLAMVYGLRQFEQVYLLTNGGPANKTMVIALYLYKQLQNYSYGIANASGMMLILTGTLVIITVKVLFKGEQYQM